MNKTDRRPIYQTPTPKAGPYVRVVSAPGGLWQLQQHDGNSGSRERDPWFGRGTPQDLDSALAAMGGNQ